MMMMMTMKVIISIDRCLIMSGRKTPSIYMHRKFYGDCPRGTPPPGQLNPRVVSKYSDFGPTEGYISETVHDTK